MEEALAGYACFGSWPDIRPLVQGLRNCAANLSQSERKTFAEFDAFLDWILDQAPISETEG